MATQATTNLGATFTHAGDVIGDKPIVDFPEVSTGKASTTNHAGGGVAESIPNGLITVGEFTVTVILIPGVMSALYTKIQNKIVAAVVLNLNGVNTMTFQGYILSFKPEPADAENPQANKASVVVAATGGITFS